MSALNKTIMNSSREGPVALDLKTRWSRKHFSAVLLLLCGCNSSFQVTISIGTL